MQTLKESAVFLSPQKGKQKGDTEEQRDRKNKKS